MPRMQTHQAGTGKVFKVDRLGQQRSSDLTGWGQHRSADCFDQQPCVDLFGCLDLVWVSCSLRRSLLTFGIES